ncbi:MAG: DUF2846 domain-containing protein [Bacteroidetes bacterium]|nr:DUF2846 domain-containing protein [Fibrella sp.]
METTLTTRWLLLALLVHPGSTDPFPDEPAQLIIYRQKEFGGGTYTIHVNEKKIGSLPPNRYVRLTVSPGRVRIQSGMGYYADKQTVLLTLQSGGTYYIKAVEEMDFLTRTLLMAPVAEEQALREMGKLRRIQPNSPDQPY